MTDTTQTVDVLDISPTQREIELNHPDSDMPLGIHIMLVPMSDKRVKAVERGIRDKIMKLQSKGKAPKATEIEENEIELIMAAMIGWRWEGREEPENDLIVPQPALSGDPKPPFNPKNVKLLLKSNGGWAKEQIDAELGNTGDFFAN